MDYTDIQWITFKYCFNKKQGNELPILTTFNICNNNSPPPP